MMIRSHILNPDKSSAVKRIDAAAFLTRDESLYKIEANPSGDKIE